LVLGREEEAAAGIGLPPIAERRRTALIVAMSDAADPGQAVAGELLDLFGRLALRQQANELPVAALHRVFGLAITCLDFFEAQMRLDADWLFHNGSISRELILSARRERDGQIQEASSSFDGFGKFPVTITNHF